MKTLKIAPISKDDTSIFKAIAIILIVLHNYYRWVEPITGENEFYFNESYIRKSLDLLSTNLFQFFNVFFNYIGHFGVQIFIFLSAYGLTKGYLGKKSFSYQNYIYKRFRKIYPTLLLSAFAMIIFNIAAHGNLPSKGTLIDIGIQLSLLSTFMPEKALVVVGPWWFFSFIFQFYLVFPLLLKFLKKNKNAALIIVSLIGYVLVIFVNPLLLKYKINMMQTVFGHLPEICIGIWFASHKQFKLNLLIYILFWGIFLLGNYYKAFWYLSHLSFIVVVFPILHWLSRYIGRFNIANKILLFIGTVSVYIFATHGFLRWDFTGLANSLNHPFAALLIGIMFFLFSLGFSWMLFSADVQMRKWVDQEGAGKKRLRRIAFLILLLGGLAVSVKACQSINYAKSRKKEKEQLSNLYQINKQLGISFCYGQIAKGYVV